MIPALILDADQERRAVYEQALGRAFDMGFAAHVEEARTAFTQARPILAVICVDLPEGLAFARELKSGPNAAGLKILLVGAELNAEVLGRDTARQMGGDDLLGLPLDERMLKLKVRDLLAELAQARKAAASEKASAQSTSSPAVAPEPAQEPPAIQTGDPLETARRLYPELDDLDYYTLLGVSPSAALGIIRKAYFRFARFIHPDRFAMEPDETLKQEIGAVFKRMCEAYKVLGDSDDRAAYDRLRESQGAKRYIRTDKTVDGPRAKETEIVNPQARKFFSLAQNSLNDGNLSAAKMNLTLALSLAPNEPVIKAALDEVKARIENA